jgi:hypothetical protein
MLLLVSAAAVFFLVQRNTQLEDEMQQAGDGSELERAALVATRDRLMSDIAVRQAALDAASATRDTLATESELAAERSLALETSLEQQEASIVEAQATLQSLSLQVFLIAPADGVTVPPLETLDIMATARAGAGLNLLSLAVNDEVIAQLPAERQSTMNVRADWTPLEEGLFVIRVEAFTADGRSESAEVTINAAYASDEAREAALGEQLDEVSAAQRFPAPAPEEPIIAAEAAAGGAVDAPLHRLLLTGRAIEDEQSIADEAFTLQALELLISDADYRAYLDTVVGADLRAYFDPDDGSLTVYRPGDEEGAFGRWQGIHALAHKLQDERFGLDELAVTTMDGDRRLAARALAEGDAAFLQHHMLVNGLMADEQVAEVRSALAAAPADATLALPAPLQETFDFAYAQGVPFIQALYNEGGFDTVDGAWRDQPVSSEQIIHPERYLAQEAPLPVSLNPLNDLLGPEWRLVTEDSFGEFLLRQHLGRQPLTVAAIDRAATGWGGGRYAVYQGQNNDIPLVVIRLVWDRAEDGDEFVALYAEYLSLRYAGEETSTDGGGRCWQDEGGAGCLFQAGQDSLVVRAPSLELASAVAQTQ